MLWTVVQLAAALFLGSIVLALAVGAFVSVNRRVDARQLIDLVLDTGHQGDGAGAGSGVDALRGRMSPPR